jgi:hypothetical protein
MPIDEKCYNDLLKIAFNGNIQEVTFFFDMVHLKKAIYDTPEKKEFIELLAQIESFSFATDFIELLLQIDSIRFAGLVAMMEARKMQLDNENSQMEQSVANTPAVQTVDNTPAEQTVDNTSAEQTVDNTSAEQTVAKTPTIQFDVDTAFRNRHKRNAGELYPHRPEKKRVVTKHDDIKLFYNLSEIRVFSVSISENMFLKTLEFMRNYPKEYGLFGKKQRFPSEIFWQNRYNLNGNNMRFVITDILDTNGVCVSEVSSGTIKVTFPFQILMDVLTRYNHTYNNKTFGLYTPEGEELYVLYDNKKYAIRVLIANKTPWY